MLGSEGQPAARLGGGTRVVVVLGASLLLAIGGKAVWHGMPISERGVIGASEACSDAGQSCSESLCCTDPASRCYRKSAGWATCNATCDRHMLWTDDGWARQDEKVWECELIGAAKDGENCMQSKTCVNSDSHCYRKNKHWASCNKTCDKNMLWVTDAWVAQDEKVWDCHILSAAHDGENCMESKTCSNPKSQCFKKNEHWASCNATCSTDYLYHGEDGWVQKPGESIWDCKVMSCVADGENCMDSRCCENEGSSCFQKNEHWASCNATCSENNLWTADGWTDSGQKQWDCKELFPHSHDESETCDTSGCDGCSGEQCQYCREGKERDCCLDQACKWASGEQVAHCKEENLKTCCEGKTGHCLTTDAPTDEPVDGETDAPTDETTDVPTDAPTDETTDEPTDAPSN